MATYQILYWQEIPSQVDARDAGKAHKEMLSQRFQELIDIVATKRNLVESDDYIAGWSKGDKSERPGSAIDVAKGVAAELEAEFDSIRTAALAAGGSGRSG
ncbi:MAG: virulence factor [Betaproteobacteria bacterium]